jgi:NAD(P)-dependent dehydrogenase (short-subunit alcohol dehydrogenase family)
MISDLQRPTNSGFGQNTEPDEILNNINLDNKNIVITGGYSGIGLETTKALRSAGARTIIPAKREDIAKSALKNIVPEEDIFQMDLADLNSVKKFTDAFHELNINLDILINNAGIMACPETKVGNGWESQFAVNHIGHHLLTKELMNSFNENGESRLVSLSSSAHSISKILWNDIHFEISDYNKWAAYGQSKTASSLLAVEFDRKMKNRGIRGFSVHPGGIITPLQRHLANEEMVALGWKKEDGSLSDLATNFFKSPTQGASTTLWCATNPELNNIGGVFCENCDIAELKNNLDESQHRFFGVAEWAIDSEEAIKLWEVTDTMISDYL